VFAAVNLSRHVSLENVESGSGNEVLDADFAGDPAEARRNWAPYFYTFFDTFPGERGYDVLDVGDYLSIVMLDTYHSNAVYGDQTEWLDTTLQERRDVEHVFPHLHTPIYPSHRDENQVYTRHIQDAWRPLLEREQIPITFGHHDHTTKLTPPLLDGEIDEENGLVEIGDGCMGRGPREPDPEREWIEQAEAANCVNIVTIDGEVFEDDDFRWSEPEEAEEDYIGTHIHWQFSTPPKEPGEYWFEWECYKDGEPVYDFFPLGQYITVEEGTHDGHDHDDQ
jgi:hypothetical protein